MLSESLILFLLSNSINKFNHWRSYHYAVTYVRNKNINIHGRSPYVAKVISMP